jgi:hypothetical protein
MELRVAHACLKEVLLLSPQQQLERRCAQLFCALGAHGSMLDAGTVSAC